MGLAATGFAVEDEAMDAQSVRSGDRKPGITAGCRGSRELPVRSPSTCSPARTGSLAERIADLQEVKSPEVTIVGVEDSNPVLAEDGGEVGVRD